MRVADHTARQADAAGQGAENAPGGPEERRGRQRQARDGSDKGHVVSAPIIGATKPHHLDDAAAAVDLDLTPEEVTALEEHYQVRAAGGFKRPLSPPRQSGPTARMRRRAALLCNPLVRPFRAAPAAYEVCETDRFRTAQEPVDEVPESRGSEW